jgi:hypothetical protein
MGRAYRRIIETNEVSPGAGCAATEKSRTTVGSIDDYDQSVLGCYENALQPAPQAEAVGG